MNLQINRFRFVYFHVRLIFLAFKEFQQKDVDGKCARSIKYLTGVLSGLPIVSMGWLYASKDAGMWVDETPHIVCDFYFGRDDNVVLTSLQRYRDHCAPLFSGLRFYFHGVKFGAFELKELCRVVETGGGSVLSQWDPSLRGDETVFVICDSSIPLSEAEGLYATTGRDPIFSVWLFDCVSSLSIRSAHHSHTYKKTFFEDSEIVRFATQNSPTL